ncbi:hypothetical protein EJ377_13865 (plasmid) [Chryseobacterium arthrosphaerae]|uniref:Uncharacterized protein n=1 Tax=Chryseobacterium arthrosphaerae TaxID=651561 RepID=A0A432DY89_9FLAO|nr:hypothetical protein EJ377_13865 [Chryseobacterium arthrosphaerae]
MNWLQTLLPFFLDYNWKDALKGVGLGLGGAVVGFALEQSVNVYENSLQSEAMLNKEKWIKQIIKTILELLHIENNIL